MKREQRHTVHYLAALAKNGDEWAYAQLKRLSDLAIAGGGGTARSSLPLSGGPGCCSPARVPPLAAGASSADPVPPLSPTKGGSQ